jgi:hypothetical protein
MHIGLSSLKCRMSTTEQRDLHVAELLLLLLKDRIPATIGIQSQTSVIEFNIL